MTADITPPQFVMTRLTKSLIVIGPVLALLTACSTFNQINPFNTEIKPPLKCPIVKLLSNADKIVSYGPSKGRDINDIKFEAEIVGFFGECKYIKENGRYTSVLLDVSIDFEVVRGPAAKSPNIQLDYFVALPDFFPKPEGKKMFSKLVAFPRNRNSVSITDKDIEIVIPLNEKRRGPETKIIAGFNLSAKQLESDRRRKFRIKPER